MNTLLGGDITSSSTKSCMSSEESKTLVGDYSDEKCTLSPKTTKHLNCENTPLLKENYLSEFLTKSEKKKVRDNLGINSTVEWGEIGGYIESQPDLYDKLTSIDLGIKQLDTEINERITKALTFPESSPYESTGLTIGGLSKGSDIRNKSLMEVLDGFLYPEYLPKFIDASDPILNFNGSSTRTFEVGTILPNLNQFNSFPGSPAVAIAGDYIIYGGNGICNNITYNNTAGGELGAATSTKGNCIFSVICNYSAGAELIKTSKGNNTQYTSSNTDTLVANGSDASKTKQIDNGWVLKEITGKKASITFNYQYKFFATTEQAGVLDSGILKDSLGIWDITLKAGGGNQSMFFIVPPKTVVTSIMGYNEVSGKYDQDQTDNFETSPYTYTLPSGATVSYTKYAYKNAPTENFKIQIS